MTNAALRPLNRCRARRLRSHGAILAITLVVLVVVMLFAAGIARAMVLQHRQGQRLEQRQQALWLAESALQRARVAVAKDPAYKGETWLVPETTFGNGHTGVVNIRVENQTAPRQGHLLRVEAYFPEQSLNRLSFERESFVEQSRPGGTL